MEYEHGFFDVPLNRGVGHVLHAFCICCEHVFNLIIFLHFDYVRNVEEILCVLSTQTFLKNRTSDSNGRMPGFLFWARSIRTNRLLNF